MLAMRSSKGTEKSPDENDNDKGEGKALYTRPIHVNRVGLFYIVVTLCFSILKRRCC